MRILLIVLLPFVMIGMDGPTLEQKTAIGIEYFQMRVKIANTYLDLLDQVKTVEALEKDYAHLFTPNFYRDLYFEEIIPALGFAQEYYQTIEKGVSKNMPISGDAVVLSNFAKNNLTVLGYAKAKLLLIQELNEQYRKKAGL